MECDNESCEQDALQIRRLENFDENEKNAVEQETFWLKCLITDNVNIIIYVAVFLFIGHKSFGMPDYGVTPLHLFATGLFGAFAIWCGVKIVDVRQRKRLRHGFRECGFTDDEIADLNI